MHIPEVLSSPFQICIALNLQIALYIYISATYTIYTYYA